MNTPKVKVDYPIVLATLNARYIHSAFGLRYLKANLGDLEPQCIINEFTLDSRPADVAEQLLAHKPRIIGLGVYIWNVRQTEQLVALLKSVAPQVTVVLGGPEVSYEYEGQRLFELADYIITGWGEKSFADLARGLLNESMHDAPQGGSHELPSGTLSNGKVIAGIQAPLASITMPYRLYDEDDLRHRVLYVEASRGCPFKCEFCLSALDKTAWPFDLDLFLAEMDELFKRGARHFKFVDRTFNLKIKNSLRILEFFLERLCDDLFLHFEVVPDHLPDALKDMIARFPPGSLQFEIGIQTFNPDVQARISRKQNNEAAQDNMRWILEHTQAHVHADLIFGLPGESLASFAASFDRLYALRPHEIQVGILKRLKGSPIIRHVDEYQMVFNPEPPFNILASSEFDFQTVQQIARFARFWDLLGNSGRFKHSLPLLLAEQPFANFSLLSEALFVRSGQTHKISLLRLFDLVHDVAADQLVPQAELIQALQQDFARSGLKSTPKCLMGAPLQALSANRHGRHKSRQARH